MLPAGDHYDRLMPDEKLAEDAIRAGKPDGAQIRAESLCVYPDSEMAQFDWTRRKARHLYKLEVDEADIRHRGDLQVFRDVVTTIRKKESADELVQKYWTGAELGRHTELLVSKATVIERLKHASEHMSLIKRATQKERDDPDSQAFYEQMFHTKKDADSSE